MIDEFCKKCGIKINAGLILGIGGTKHFKFEDGTYCENCAKIKVDKARQQ